MGAVSARYPTSSKSLVRRVNQTASKAVFLLAKIYYAECMPPPQNQSKEIGNIGERIAANYFKALGCEIVRMNFENKLGYRLGELDVVVRDPKTSEIIFAEVKTRQKGTSNSETPELAIGRAKYRKLSKIIASFLRKNNLLDCNYHLDAIAIELDMKTRKASLKHLKCIYY